MVQPTLPSELPSPRRSSLLRCVIVGAMLGSTSACLAEIGRMVVDRNTHVAQPQRLYRTAQLKPAHLERLVRDRNIKTVINLRGRPFSDWYPKEAQVTQMLGISQEDVTISANRLPSSGEIRRLVEILEQSEYPIVLHCQQGADRTGLVSVMYQLLFTDADYSTARQQCSPRFAHVPVHTTLAMDDFFEQYEDWLASQGASHTPARFRHWAMEEYCPGPGRARMEVLSSPNAAEVGKPIVFKVRAYNNSRETWSFHAGARTGVHATYTVIDAFGKIAFSGQAGFLDAMVPPGGFIDLELPVPGPKSPGRYILWVDLSQRNVCFTQYGSEPLTHDWEARNPIALRDR